MQTILEKLVAIPTVSGDYAANNLALDYIEKQLRAAPLQVERREWNGFGALYASPSGSKTPKVLLAGHIDVVHAPPEQFKLTEKDGRLYGRGTIDMKSGIATYLALVNELGPKVVDYDFGIMITSDEELGGYNGVKRFVDAGYLPQVAVLPDGGQNWKLEVSSKGFMHLRFTARGLARHGSRTWEGESAIEKMINFLRTVQYELFDFEQGPGTNTFNVGKLQGGDRFNKIADHCTADIDIRTTSNSETEHVLAKIKQLAAQNDIEYEVVLKESATKLDLTDPLVKAYIASSEKVLGKPIETMDGYASSDARHFAALGIQALMTYPEGHGHHGANEWISKKALYQYKDIIADYLEATAKAPGHLAPKTLTSVQ